MYIANAIINATMIVGAIISFVFINSTNVIINIFALLATYFFCNINIYLQNKLSTVILSFKNSSIITKVTTSSFFGVSKYTITLIPFIVLIVLYANKIPYVDITSIIFNVFDLILFNLSVVFVALLCKKNKN
jgi:hypothetical protein